MTITTTKNKRREITEEELESIQHEAFVLGQATGMLMKYGYKDLGVQLYNTSRKILDLAAKNAYEKEFGNGSK